MTTKTKLSQAKKTMDAARLAYNTYGGSTLYKELRKAEKAYDNLYSKLTSF